MDRVLGFFGTHERRQSFSWMGWGKRENNKSHMGLQCSFWNILRVTNFMEKDDRVGGWIDLHPEGQDTCVDCYDILETCLEVLNVSRERGNARGHHVQMWLFLENPKGDMCEGDQKSGKWVVYIS
jgi:hypothetical protein